MALGEWHTARASRTGRLGSLSVDEQPRVEAHSPGAFTQLSLPLNLYLGGVPDPGETAAGAAVLQSFVGCVQRVSRSLASSRASESPFTQSLRAIPPRRQVLRLTSLLTDLPTRPKRRRR